MPLAVGTRLGNIEIVGQLGAGGMGEVYRGLDTKLDREVAVKVLPPAYAQHPERLARFEREAKVLASLNHPNIATIYAVEESPDGKALVMELVKGQTLKSPVPLDTALKYAAQIASALDAAHEKGITHRDLKPANIMVTPDGTIKVLDFGLAAVTQPSQSEGEIGTNMATLTMSPTSAGMIMGTAAYMSPEQASGQPVDRRTDIWAFGVVLWELLTGKQLFEGATVSHILAAVLTKEPDYTQVPFKVRRLLRRCLEKDPQKRLLHIGDAMELVEVDAEAAPVTATTPSPSRHRSWLPWCIAAFLLLALMPANILHFRETPPPQQSYRFQIAPPPNTRFSTFRLSPDGRSVAFVAISGNLGGGEPGTLWIRALDSLESREVPGSDGTTYPFWSPDSAFVGFFQGGKLKKVAAAGGPMQTICDVKDSRGGAWGPDGTILFTDGAASPLFRVPSSGGSPAPVTKLFTGDPGEGHRAPEFLPDGRHFLFDKSATNSEIYGLAIGSLDGTAPMRLLPDNSNGVYLPPTGPGQAQTGHVLFLREGTLMAIPFDAVALKAKGEAFPVAENVAAAANNRYGAFSSAANGTVAYWSGGLSDNRQLVWLDRSGKQLGVLGKPGAWNGAPAVSPDERSVAVALGNSPQYDIWSLDVASGTSTRLTFGLVGAYPVWFPDGRSMIYSRHHGVTFDIVRRQISGGTEETLLENGINTQPRDVSPDGKFVVHDVGAPKTGFDIRLTPVEGDHKESVYLTTPANERNPKFSPDGKWMAYQSDESGQNQVYVQTIPAGGSKFQISTTGGTFPAWRRDGKELYYRAADQKMMSVPMKISGTSFEPGAPQALFTAFGAAGFAVTRDGQRFLMNVPAGGESAASGPPLTVVTNWQAGLKK